jgi:glucose uptake protein
MILPTTYTVALLLTIVSMICWGSWANTFKLSGKWRFELFYFDYSLGVLIAAVVVALTLGMMGPELSFTDNLSITGKRQMFLALAGGVVFNLANMLLVAAISVAGMAVAFPVGIGLALVIGVVWNFLLNPGGNGSPSLLFGGVALVVLAIILDALAYGAHAKSQPATLSSKKPSSGKGIVLSLVSGVLMGSFYPLVQMGREGEFGFGLGPYTAVFFFSLGVFFSTFVFNVYFMNLPVEGQPVEFSKYLSGTSRQHLLGIFGGVIWCSGLIANFTASSAPPKVQVGAAVSYAIGQGATLISALWGLLIWKEFAGAIGRVRLLLALMLLCFVVGLTLISIAPLYAA